jgi:peptidylprolyl isomerase
MPTVVFGDDGIPVVTMPEGVAAPDTTRIGVIKEGDGAVVASGDSVTVNYHGVLWDDGTVFDSSYESGTPATFTTTGVVPGFKAALEGQKVGSQVIAVVAPADGYGASGSGSIPANATLVFVIDIISVG